MSLYDEAEREMFVAKGLGVYEGIKGDVQAEHLGEIVAIHPETGEYFVGKTLVKTNEKAYSVDRDAWFLFVRIGDPGVHIPLRAW